MILQKNKISADEVIFKKEKNILNRGKSIFQKNNLSWGKTIFYRLLIQFITLSDFEFEINII